MQEELQILKKNNNANKNYKIIDDKKYPLNIYHLSIIILILTIMIIFIFYKIGYFILITEYNNNKIYENNINQNNNIETNTNIEEDNNNINLELTIEDILIPISYSKYLEDLILNVFFYNIDNGFYIDISSYGQNGMSSTKYFYLKGWNGINIKPDIKIYKQLLKQRPDDINLNYYVGGKIYKIYNKTNPKIHKISDILKNYLPKKKLIHFCKIDVEGDVRKILLDFDFNNYRPKIFCIESVKPGTFRPNYENFEYILKNNDYSFIYQYKINRYYLDNKIINLKKRKNIIDDVIKTYRKSKKDNLI